MSTDTTIRNKHLAALMEQAIEKAKAYWVGIQENGIEVLPRKEVYFEPDDRGEVHFNASVIEWGPVNRCMTAEIAIIAKSKDGPPVLSSAVTEHGIPCARMAYGDRLRLEREHLRIAGKMP